MNVLCDAAGDLWEVLPESGYTPQQDENWIRYQDEEMREWAERQTETLILGLVDPTEAGDAAWAECYVTRGHPRVWVREIERPDGGTSWKGAHGVYEVVAWLGLGAPGYLAGAMNRLLVRPGARWYAEQAGAAAISLAALDPEDESTVESRAELQRVIDHNKRAHRIASMATRELSIVEMQRALVAQEV